MTGPEFAAAHGNDSSTWTPADFEAAEVLASIDSLPRPCWFCSAPNPASATLCGFCSHHSADAPAA